VAHQCSIWAIDEDLLGLASELAVLYRVAQKPCIHSCSVRILSIFDTFISAIQSQDTLTVDGVLDLGVMRLAKTLLGLNMAQFTAKDRQLGF
jgi:hypothetical protein